MYLKNPKKSRSCHVVVGMNNFLVSPFIFNSVYQVGTAVCRSCGYVTTNIWEMSGSWLGVGRSCKHQYYKFAHTLPASDSLSPLSPFQPPRAGISKSSYIGISIPIKYSNFSRFYKKLGPFYKKLRCDKFGN